MGGPTAEELISEAGLDVPEEPEAVQDLWRAYCDGYCEGVQHGAEHEARAWLGIPDGVDLGDCGSRLDQVLTELREGEDQ